MRVMGSCETKNVPQTSEVWVYPCLISSLYSRLATEPPWDDA